MSTISKSNQRWKSPLLWCVLAAFIYLSVSGFALLFMRPWIGDFSWISWSHWFVGLLCMLPYAAYQLGHYRRVKQYHAQLHFKLGLFTFYSFLISAVSGTILEVPKDELLNLLHIMSSFAFLIFIFAHLVLVLRLAGLKATGTR